MLIKAFLSEDVTEFQFEVKDHNDVGLATAFLKEFNPPEIQEEDAEDSSPSGIGSNRDRNRNRVISKADQYVDLIDDLLRSGEAIEEYPNKTLRDIKTVGWLESAKPFAQRVNAFLNDCGLELNQVERLIRYRDALLLAIDYLSYEYLCVGTSVPSPFGHGEPVNQKFTAFADGEKF